MSKLCIVFVAPLLTFLAARADAEWSVVNLHPSQASFSRLASVGGGQQGGAVQIGSSYHASLWSGSAGSWVSLGPGAVLGVGFGNQVGAGDGGGTSGYAHASLWRGTAESRVDLHPAGTIQSGAVAVDATQQVGSVYVVGGQHASLWSGTADSWVDLHPAWAIRSEATGVSRGSQVGYVAWDISRASLWHGTAESWVDLHPAAAGHSRANGVDGAWQVGQVILGSDFHASLWNGTASSWVDLNPKGAVASDAVGVSGVWQVGVASVHGVSRASLWSGTAASWVDLSLYLPAGSFAYTYASGIWTDSHGIYISGAGYNRATRREEALMWVSPVPEPACLIALGTGISLLRVRRRRSPD